MIRAIRLVLLALSLQWTLAATFAASVNDFIDFSLKSGSTTLLPGRLYVPAGYNPADTTRTYPIVTFFHGYGEGGTNNLDQINGNINGLLAACKARGAFLYAPQSGNGLWAGSSAVITPQMTDTIAMLDEALAAYNIDPNRQYVTGLSAGGSGTWDAASKFPGRFAAAAPLCADWIRGQPFSGVLADMPVWAFHARDDASGNDVTQTEKTVINILTADGYHWIKFPLDEPDGKDFYDGTPYYTDGSTFFEHNLLRYTEYVSGGHSIWGRVYAEQPLYDWMFSQAVPEPASIIAMAFLAMVALKRPARSRHG